MLLASACVARRLCRPWPMALCTQNQRRDGGSALLRGRQQGSRVEDLHHRAGDLPERPHEGRRAADGCGYHSTCMIEFCIIVHDTSNFSRRVFSRRGSVKERKTAFGFGLHRWQRLRDRPGSNRRPSDLGVYIRKATDACLA
jgi:hypothetical protein